MVSEVLAPLALCPVPSEPPLRRLTQEPEQTVRELAGPEGTGKPHSHSQI